MSSIENRIRASLIALKAKNLLPKHTIGYFDEAHIPQLARTKALETFDEWSCPRCPITVYGTKKMLLEHYKTHTMKRHIGENEYSAGDAKLY